MASLWDPDGTPEATEEGNGEEKEDVLHIDASPAFKVGAVVEMPRARMRAIVASMRRETAADLRALSNRLFRTHVGRTAEEWQTLADDGDAWPRFCGDVAVFYCVRFVLDGRCVPVVVTEETTTG